MVKIRRYLKQEGYEKEDFIKIENKRPLLCPEHIMYLYDVDDRNG